MSKNLILIGMRGSGKTSVSKLLSEKLTLRVIDTDEEIEKLEKMAIRNIVEKNGWDYFRNLETAVLKTLENKTNLILSTGGGIILKEENRKILKKLGLIFYLHGKPEILYQRIGEDKKRPNLTNADNMLNDLKNLYKQREEIYKTTADYLIDTENLSIKQVVDKIVKTFTSYK